MGAMSTCRACRRGNLYLFLPLGSHPPANAFLTREQLGVPEPSFDLDTHVCLDCALIQVPNVIPPDFFRNYLYVPSASATMHEHFGRMARTLKDRFLRSPTDLVVDIGSNDGLFLEAVKEAGARPLGIEPAVNLTRIARDKGLQVFNEYFGPAMARAVREQHGPARVIVTTNTFNHIDDLHAFVEGVTLLLDQDGTFVIEVPQAIEFVRKHEFDTIYHEHLSTFSVQSLVALFQFFDLEIFDIEELLIHGGSMRVFVRRRREGKEPLPAVREWLSREQQARLFDRATYATFRESVQKKREETLALLSRLKQQGKRIAGYGAPAKGNTLLNYYGIGPALLDYLVDKNALKHGAYSPGMHLPIYPTEWIPEDRPDYLLILAWNFADEILQQQAAHRSRGGRFIVPIPELQVIE